MALEPFQTAHGSDFPLCVQLSVFLENRLGQLLRLTRLFDQGDVRLRCLAVDASADCAVLRLLVNEPDRAHEMISDAGFACTESEVLVVEIPPGKRGIMTVCTALIQAEVNINFVAPLLPGPNADTCVAFSVDDVTRGAESLILKNFRLLDQSEL